MKMLAEGVTNREQIYSKNWDTRKNVVVALLLHGQCAPNKVPLGVTLIMAPMASISPRLPQPPPVLNFVICSVLLPLCSVQCAVCSVQCGTIKGLRSNKLDLLCPILWGLWQQFLVMIIVIICLNQKFIFIAHTHYVQDKLSGLIVHLRLISNWWSSSSISPPSIYLMVK